MIHAFTTCDSASEGRGIAEIARDLFDVEFANGTCGPTESADGVALPR
jgi:hypothetical protein